MISQKLLITNPVGLHMRPAAVFAGEMMNFTCDITIVFNGSRVNAKSILNIMTACIKCGDEITLECSGEDEEAAAERAAKLIRNGCEG